MFYQSIQGCIDGKVLALAKVEAAANNGRQRRDIKRYVFTDFSSRGSSSNRICHCAGPYTVTAVPGSVEEQQQQR